MGTHSMMRNLTLTIVVHASIAMASRPQSQQVGATSPLERRNYCISKLKTPDAQMRDPASGESMRDLFVHELTRLDPAVLDRATVEYVLRLVEDDESEWVRLEAAADIADMPIPSDLEPKVIATLEKCRADKRVNFQVLASQSLLKLAAKGGRTDSGSEKALARVAQGQDLAKWTVMIPAHNAGKMIREPGSKTEIPVEQYMKTNMRVNAVHALGRSKSDFAKGVIAGLAKDGNDRVRDAVASVEAGK
jgi:HEAT repeat protein